MWQGGIHGREMHGRKHHVWQRGHGRGEHGWQGVAFVAGG